MEHVLARHAALQAATAKITAQATLHATATAFGCKDAHQGYNQFLREMDSIIEAAGPQEELDPTQPAPEELAFLQWCEARAR